MVKVRSKNTIKDLFGSLKVWKIDTQKMKDEIRKEEEEVYKRKFGKLEKK